MQRLTEDVTPEESSAGATGMAAPPRRGQGGFKSQMAALGRAAASAVKLPDKGGASRVGRVLEMVSMGHGMRPGSVSSDCTGRGQC